jgi:sulfate adenylyltransferase subunit 1 (EFTu-like GTPase family)
LVSLEGRTPLPFSKLQKCPWFSDLSLLYYLKKKKKKEEDNFNKFIFPIGFQKFTFTF